LTSNACFALPVSPTNLSPTHFLFPTFYSLFSIFFF
jgi:hypothetical protein